jgi:hypothetical protein
MRRLMSKRARQATVAISMVLLTAVAGATHAAGAAEPDTPAVRLSVSDALVVEGDQGARGARTTISLSSPLDADLEISYRTVDGSATAGSDYRAAGRITARTTTIRAGETSKSVLNVVRGDISPEATETFLVEVTGIGDSDVVPYRTKGQVTVIDDDGGSPGEPALRGGSVHVVEGDDGRTVVPMMLELSEPLDTALVVHVTTLDASATSPADYRAVTRDVTFRPGRTMRYIPVAVQGDTTHEGDEAFVVELATDHPGVSVGAGRVVILDDDQPAPPPEPPAIEVPGAPTSPVVTKQSTIDYRITWAAPADDGGAPVTDYRVTRVVNGATFDTWTTGGTRTATSYCIPGRHCRWEIKAVNSVGTGPALVTTTVYDEFRPPPCRVCGPPKG